MTSFGRNEIDKYFDLKQDYAVRKKGEEYNFLTFMFKCKNDADIPVVVEAFNKMISGSKDIFKRIKGNNLYVEIRFGARDLFEIDEINLDDICFSSGESLIIKTEAIPRDFFNETDKEKIKKYILNTELEFSNISPQLQLCFKAFQKISKVLFKYSFTYLKDIIKDIYVNLLNGNYK